MLFAMRVKRHWKRLSRDIEDFLTLGHAGWSCKQSDIVKDILGRSRGLGTKGDLQICQCGLGVGEGLVADDLPWHHIAHTG